MRIKIKILFEKIKFLKASSPDEVALVNFARYCDIEFMGVDENNDMIIREKNKQLKYRILHIFEFDSTRY